MNSAPNDDRPGAGIKLNEPEALKSCVKSSSVVPVPLACACNRCDPDDTDTYGDEAPNPTPLDATCASTTKFSD